MERTRITALYAIAGLIGVADSVSFAESYRGLLLWAAGHDVPSGWSAVWPLMVDMFIIVGEIVLFVAIVDGWESRARRPAWISVGFGVLVSVAGNVGHVYRLSGITLQVADRVTASIPPLAAASALALGLGVLKRVVAGIPRRARQPIAARRIRIQHRAIIRRPRLRRMAATPTPEPAAAGKSPRRGRRAAPLDPGMVQSVRDLIAQGPLTDRQVAEQFGVSRHTGGRVLAAASNGHAGG